MKIAVSAGHYPERPGCSASQLTEHHECMVLAALVVNLAGSVGIKAHMIGTGNLIKKVDEINNGGYALGIEIHLNAGGGSGCEILHYPDSKKGISLATEIQHCIVDRTDIRDRGIKTGYYKTVQANGLCYILAHTNCPFIIIEPFFLDSHKDRARFINADSYLSIAAAIVEGLLRVKS